MQKNHKYHEAIDGLRAFACLLVTIFHSSQLHIIQGGYIGVDLFFVLSGYLITQILVREMHEHGRIDVMNFLLHRALRLLPALLLLLFTYVIVAPQIWPEHPHIRDAFITLFYISDYSFAHFNAPHYMGHSWSLSVEEKFYLIWPLIIPILLKSQKPLLWIFTFYIIATLTRYYFIGMPSNLAYFQMHTHMSGLLLGGALAFIDPSKLETRHNIYVILFIAIFLAAINISPMNSPILPITIAEICSAVIILHIVSPSQSLVKNALSSPPLRWIGGISYSLYLWHYPFAVYFRETTDPLSSVIWTLICSVPCAIISFHTVEKWGRQKKQALRLLPAKIQPIPSRHPSPNRGRP